MKIRNGFVSNSSSSSFVAVCKELTLSTATFEKDLMLYGTYLYEGYDLIELDENMLKLAKIYDGLEPLWDGGYQDSDYNEFKLYKIFKFSYDDTDFDIDTSEYPNQKLTIISLTADQNATSNVSEFVEKYAPENHYEEYHRLGFEKYIQKYLRANKLERILK